MLPVVTGVAIIGAAVVAARRWPAAGRRERWLASLLLAALALSWCAAVGWFDVRKVLGTSVMPLGLVWLGGFAMAWRLSGRAPRRLVLLAWALWLTVTFGGSPLVGAALVGWLERPFAGVDPLERGPFDAVLVLGGGLTETAGGRLTLGEAGDRVVLAARMARAGRARVVVASGPLFPLGPRPTTSIPALTRGLWLELGVEPSSIEMLVGPSATREEVEAFAALCRERGWRRVGIITSATHLRRAMAHQRRLGLDAEPLPANPAAVGAPLRPVHLVPQADGVRMVHDACWELLGAALGR